jgi:hypothetical protein
MEHSIALFGSGFCRGSAALWRTFLCSPIFQQMIDTHCLSEASTLAAGSPRAHCNRQLNENLYSTKSSGLTLMNPLAVFIDHG